MLALKKQTNVGWQPLHLQKSYRAFGVCRAAHFSPAEANGPGLTFRGATVLALWNLLVFQCLLSWELRSILNTRKCIWLWSNMSILDWFCETIEWFVLFLPIRSMSITCFLSRTCKHSLKTKGELRMTHHMAKVFQHVHPFSKTHVNWGHVFEPFSIFQLMPN